MTPAADLAAPGTARVLALTGATGFIGGALLEACARTWTVRALVRRVPRRWVLPPTVEVIHGSLADHDALTTLVRGAAAIVHCAGAVRGARSADFDAANVQGTSNLIRAATQAAPDARMLFLSSLAAREPALSPYAASKRRAEVLMAETSGSLAWLALRPPAVYGPGDRELRPLLRWMARGLAPRVGAPDARFSMLYIADLIAAVEAWLAQPRPATGVYALHDGAPGGYRWADVCGVMAQIRAGPVRTLPVPEGLLDVFARLNQWRGRYFGPPPMLTAWKLRELRHPDWVCDNADFSAAVAWAPRVTLADGLRATLGDESA